MNMIGLAQMLNQFSTDQLRFVLSELSKGKSLSEFVPDHQKDLLANAGESSSQLSEQADATKTFALQRKSEDGPAPELSTEAFRQIPIGQGVNGFEVGMQIGPFLLVRLLGTGGMGQVWLADQLHPVRRQIALKVIRTAAIGQEYVARFLLERQALALMNHENIARILEIGATDSGIPYYAMEHIEGLPLTEYCDKHQLSLRSRLDLFIGICRGIQHAHQKGIIHRDLKPSNILVTLVEGKPIAKIIDFGLAKATTDLSEEWDRTSMTLVGQVLGTYRYMSPEQASLKPTDVDTRTDIYALGAILYELLTGQSPLEDKLIFEAGVLRILEAIQQEEPLRPSLRMHEMSREKASGITRRYGLDSGRLERELSGDLDWIVMKALEKDRNRRYDSATGLAEDVERYIRHEPVSARPPSFSYRIRKFARKNRVTVSVISTLLATLTIGVIGTTAAMFRAMTAEANAVSAEKDTRIALQQKTLSERAERIAKLDALDSAKKEKIARAHEERERRHAESITGFVVNDFLALMTVEGQERFDGYDSELTKDVSLRTLLDRAAARLELREDLSPASQAELYWILGVTYRNLDQHELATKLFRKCVEIRTKHFGPEHSETLYARNSYGISLFDIGDKAEGLRVLRENSEVRAKVLGDHDRFYLSSLINLGYALHAAEDFTEALVIYDRAQKLAEEVAPIDETIIQQALEGIADVYFSQGEDLKAIDSAKKAYELAQRLYGEDSSNAIISLKHLAMCCTYSNPAAALDSYRKALTLADKKFGSPHRLTFEARRGVVVSLLSLGRGAEAKESAEKLVEEANSLYGPESEESLEQELRLVDIASQEGAVDEAISRYEQLLARAEKSLGKDHELYLNIANQLGAQYFHLNRLDKSIPIFESLLQAYRRTHGPTHPRTIRTLSNLGSNYMNAGRINEAVKCFEMAYEELDESRKISTRVLLIRAYVGQRESNKLAAMVKLHLAEIESSDAISEDDKAGFQAYFGEQLTLGGAYPDAIATLSEYLKYCDRDGKTNWQDYRARSLLSAAVIGRESSLLSTELVHGPGGIEREIKSLIESIHWMVEHRAEAAEWEFARDIPAAYGTLLEAYRLLGNEEEAVRYEAELHFLLKSN